MADRKPKAKRPRRSKNVALSEHEQVVGELTADLQRTQADFANFKRRNQEDLERAVAIGKESMIARLLPTLDNIERALTSVPQDLNGHSYVKGIQAVAKQLEASLKEVGVTKITTLGQPFDAAVMEAVAMEDAGGDTEVVCEELQAGYMLDDRVVRHAVVKVRKE